MPYFDTFLLQLTSCSFIFLSESGCVFFGRFFILYRRLSHGVRVAGEDFVALGFSRINHVFAPDKGDFSEVIKGNVFLGNGQ